MSQVPRKCAVIAVFGSGNQPGISLAFVAGGAIAKEGHILLTGGAGKSSNKVKDQAIEGARWVRDRFPLRRGAWIGVTQDAKEGNPNAITGDKGHALLVNTDLGHRRNYLEACLCDAAIAFSGEKGTLSEVAFSLVLDRPVVLVGSDWEKEVPRDTSAGPSKNAEPDPAQLKRVVEEAVEYVSGSTNRIPYLDKCLDPMSLAAKIQSRTAGRVYRVSDAELLGSGLANALNWLFGIVNLSSGVAYPGAFPPLETYDEVRRVYDVAFPQC